MIAKRVLDAFFGRIEIPADLRQAGITHALTWRPARTHQGETDGSWILDTIADYFDEHGRCDTGEYLNGPSDLPAGNLCVWVSSIIGPPVWLSEAEPETLPYRSSDITLRYWVRRAS